MEKVTTVGIDLAKNVFSLHGVDAHGKVALKRTVRRAQLSQPPSLGRTGLPCGYKASRGKQACSALAGGIDCR